MSYTERENGYYKLPRALSASLKSLIIQSQQEKADRLWVAATLLKDVVNALPLAVRKRLIKGEYRINMMPERLSTLLSTLYPLAESINASHDREVAIHRLVDFLVKYEGKQLMFNVEQCIERTLRAPVKVPYIGKVTLLDCEHETLAWTVLSSMTGASRLKNPSRSIIYSGVQKVRDTSLTYEFDCLLVQFDSKTLELRYYIEENNGSVNDVYCNSALFKQMLSALKRTTWTRNTGGYAQYVGEYQGDTRTVNVLGNVKVPTYQQVA